MKSFPINSILRVDEGASRPSSRTVAATSGSAAGADAAGAATSSTRTMPIFWYASILTSCRLGRSGVAAAQPDARTTRSAAIRTLFSVTPSDATDRGARNAGEADPDVGPPRDPRRGPGEGEVRAHPCEEPGSRDEGIFSVSRSGLASRIRMERSSVSCVTGSLHRASITSSATAANVPVHL